MIIKKSNVSIDLAKQIASECYVIEELDYMQSKMNKKPDVFRMFRSTEEHFIIPYHIGIKYGFKATNSNWELIQPMIETDENILDHDETNELFRKFKGIFRDYQDQPMEEILELLNQYCTVTIGLPPGWGKTMAACYLSWRLGYRTLVLMNLTEVLKGWIKSFSDYLPNFKVWIAGSNRDCPEDVDIILCMTGQFNKINPEIIRTVGTFIADEFHLLCTETRIPIFLNLFPKYIILETATLEQAKMFKVAHKISGTHGVFKDSIKPYQLFIINTGIKGEETRTKDGMLQVSKLRQNLVNNEFRKNIMLYLLMKISEYEKTICIRMVKDSIDEFVENVRGCNFTCDSLFGTKKRFNNSQITIGTSQKMGTGYDEENSCWDFYKDPVKSSVVFFENTTPNKYIYEQNRNRARDLKYVFILKDKNANSNSHIKKLMPWFKETNAIIKEINFWEFEYKEQIPKKVNRVTTDGLFYRYLNEVEYNDFLLFHIVEAGEYDIKKKTILKNGIEIIEHDLIIFSDDDKVNNFMDKNNISNGYILELQEITVFEDKDNLISGCPICDFHVIDVHKL